MDLFAGQEARFRCREQTGGHGWAGAGRTDWESSFDMYTLLCVN